MLSDMKQYVATLFLLVALFSVQAQVCDPDTSLKEPGFYPQSLIPAEAGKPYEMVLQVRALSDTLVDFNGNTIRANIDSIQLTNVIGLPDGFSYSCLNPNCVFVSTETRCSVLKGNPNNDDVGVYPLEFAVVVYARLGILRVPQPDTIRNFTLYVTGGNMHVRPTELSELKCFPNPAVKELMVDGNGREGVLFITDLSGRKMYEGEIAKSSLAVDVKNWSNGVYLLLFMGRNGQMYREKVVIQH